MRKARAAFGPLVIVALLMVAASAGGCVTYRDELARGQRAYELSDHDRTLAILRDLEPDVRRLPLPEQAQYAFLRGMTDYRVGYRADARHWLALAGAFEEMSPGVLQPDAKQRMTESLDELNAVVYSQGTIALVTPKKGPPKPPKKAGLPKQDAP